MSYDISEELNIIKTVQRGEDVRDAIVSAFRKINGGSSSIGVMLTEAEWSELTEEEKNNGIAYFISDMNIIEGDDYYFSDSESDDKVLISHNILKDAVDAIKDLLNINWNLSISQIPTLLTYNVIRFTNSVVEPIEIIDTNKIIYLYSSVNGKRACEFGRWTTSSGTCLIEVYRIEADKNYLLMFGSNTGTMLTIGFFLNDPTTATGTITGSAIHWLNLSAPAYSNYSFSKDQDGYVMIQYTSGQGKMNIDRILLDTTNVFGE